MAEWNATDDAAVREGLAAGQSYEQIASALGRTPTAVQVRMFTLGLAAQQQQLPMVSGEDAPLPKRRGRPPKNASAPVSNGHAPAAVASGEAPKRRGRPPKNASAPVSNGHAPAAVASGEAPKRRGRPPKNASAAPAVMVSGEAPKRRGRPPKNASMRDGLPRTVSVPASNGHAPVAAKPVPRAPVSVPGFVLALGAHRLSAEGAAVELIDGGGLRLKFDGGSIELHGASA